MNRAGTAAVAAGLTAGLEITDSSVPGRHGEIPVRRYRPRGRDCPQTLVWVHGGAFSHGGLDQLESHAVAAALAGFGTRVIAVDYRRVPAWRWFGKPPTEPLSGIRFPIPVDDVDDAFGAVVADHPGAALGGASAGACLSAAVALRRKSTGDVAPSQLLLAYGTFHAQLPPVPPELRRRIRGRHGILQFRASTVERMNRNYAGSQQAMGDREAFPGGHDLRGLPPTLLLDADRDSLRASGQAFAAELAAAGVEVEHRVVPESTHGFLDRPGTARFDAGIGLLDGRLQSATGNERQ